MLIEIPSKFLEKRTGAMYERIFLNTQNISCLNANGYDYGQGIQYNISLQLTNGHFVPLCYQIDEEMLLNIVEWFNAKIMKDAHVQADV